MPGNLLNLIVQRCRHLQKITGMDDLSKLTELDITECPEMELPFLAELNCLERITINSSEKFLMIILPTSILKVTVQQCRNLQVVTGIGNLSKLTELCITESPHLENLPTLYGLSSLESITIDGCGKLNHLKLTDGGISGGVSCSFNMDRLVQLWILDCPALEELPCFARLTCLEGIHIIKCTKLKKITVLSGLRNIERIKIDGCNKLNHPQATASDCAINKGVSSSFDPGHLSQLWILDCPELEELSCFAHLTCLARIHIFRCGKLKKITFPMSLKNLQLEFCKELKSVSETSHLKNLVELIISECRQLEPELHLEGMDSLQSVTFDGCGKMIVIDSCEKLQSILLPMTLIKLRVCWCRKVKKVAGIGNLTKLTNMCIGECPELEELPILTGLSYLKSINIDSCNRLHRLTLPTTLIELKVQSCRGLQRIAGICNLTKLQELYISECHQLEYLPGFAGLGCLERITIDSCDKLHSLKQPTTLIELKLQLCRGLQVVRGINNLTKLEVLSISECPELELPRYANPSHLEMITINSYEKFHNATLPTTLRKLRIKGCQELQQVAINECPKPKELSIPGRLNCLKGTIIESCKGQENIEGIEELEALEAIQFLYCSNATIKDCISKPKHFPLGFIQVIGRAENGAESNLNHSLLSEAYLHRTDIWRTPKEIIIVCCLVVVSSSAPVPAINEALEDSAWNV